MGKVRFLGRRRVRCVYVSFLTFPSSWAVCLPVLCAGEGRGQVCVCEAGQAHSSS